jgi:hypothetical protein
MKGMFLGTWCALIVAISFLASGCSSGTSVVEVNGTVTHRGKKIPRLLLNFVPETGRPSWGYSDENGRFKLIYEKDRDGIQVGKHTVWVELHAKTPVEDVASRIKEMPELAVILEKYGNPEKSPYRIDIKSDTRDIEVKLD